MDIKQLYNKYNNSMWKYYDEKNLKPEQESIPVGTIHALNRIDLKAQCATAAFVFAVYV